MLKKDEFVRDDRRLPLPVVTVKSKDALPRPDETWLFAHGHLEQAIPDSELSDLERYLEVAPGRDHHRSGQDVQPTAVATASRGQHARTTPSSCPRSKSAASPACGKPTAGVPAQKPAWDATAGVELPFYYDW